MNAALLRTSASCLLSLSILTSVFILANGPVVAATEVLPSATSNKLETLKPISAPALTTRSAAVTGPLRILLVDDDVSDNNNIPGDTRRSISDSVFSKLVAEAVGGDQRSWATEIVKTNANGPRIDQLRPYSLIIWYTGSSYGGNPDNTSVLSIEDEKTVRRYLEETGGAVLLISPGYLSKVLEQGSSWEQTSWPFLKEVLGINGGRGLAQRFQSDAVTTNQGMQFQVGKGGVVESQFSAVNPNGAETVFTAELEVMKGAVPVATAFKYGKGRFIYVGFTFENLAAKELAPAFQQLLSASSVTPASSPIAACPPSAAPSGSAQTAGPATVQVSGTPTTAVVNWALPTATLLNVSLIGTATKTRAALANQTPTPPQATSVTVERLVPNAASVRLNVTAPDAVTANDPGPLTPGQAVTYRVTLNGCDVLGTKEASFIPPLPHDPSGLAATVAANGSVTLTWQATSDAAVTGYQVTGTSLTAPVTVRYASQWTSPPQVPGSQQWKVASMYQPGGVLTAPSTWPSVMSHVVPTPGKPFLILPNGAGSHAESVAHYRTQCFSLSTDISNCRVAPLIAPETNWEAAWLSTALRWHDDENPKWPRVRLHNTLDLGAWRFANCAPRRNGRTVCWATTHHNGRPTDDQNTSYLPGAAQMPTSLSLIILLDDNRSFFGTWELSGSNLPVEVAELEARDSFVGAFDMEHSYANVAQPVTGTQLDSEGRKGVPHACLSCHGGRYDASTRLVIGASLLPVVPSRLDGSVADEFWVAPLNQIILTTNPAPAIVAQINSMYAGIPMTPGRRANDAAVPAGWSQQPGLYRQVILPYCSSCHFAQRGPLNFQTWANLLQNKTAVQRAVCSDFTMPHSEILFRKFWSEGGAVSLPGMLSTALGFQKCPQ
jgi:hypothetical protein